METIKERYLKGNGCYCPFCGSEHLNGFPYNSYDNCIEQSVRCETCGKEWKDIYKIVDIIIDEP
jgi:transposase-like protein